MRESKDGDGTPTPGPWVWDGDTMYGEPRKDGLDFEAAWKHGERSAPARTVIIETDSAYYPPRAADRALIASAPALLAALEGVVAEGNTLYRKGFDEGVSLTALDDVIEIARAALAAAKGAK